MTLLPTPQLPLSSRDVADSLIHEQLRGNPLLFAHTYFPHHVRSSTPGFHLHLLRSALQYRYLAVACPRESAKSTVLTFFYSFHGVVFKKFRFIVIVQNTFTKAAMSLATMKQELMENQHLSDDFPGVVITKDAEGDSEFRHPDGFMTKVLCKGMDQIGSIRGVKFGAYRPDLIISDDLEDDKSVQNPELRLELRTLYDQALTPAGERRKCQYIYIGTILHDDCLLAHLLEEDEYLEYCKISYQAHIHPWKGIENGEASLWPEKWTVNELRRMSEVKPDVYAKEMQNDPVAGGERRFNKTDFRYWRRDGDDYILYDGEGKVIGRNPLSTTRAGISLDLAWKQKRQSDWSVIIPGYITQNSDYLVERYIKEKGMRPDRLEEILFEMIQRLKKLTGKTVTVGIEKAMLENVSQWLLKKAMRKRDDYFPIKKLVWDADKHTRIETRLQPLYAQNVVYHLQGMGDLEQQLLRFPSGREDDIIDAQQGLIQVLRKPSKGEEAKKPQDAFEWWRQKAIEARTRAAFPGYSAPNSDGFYEIPAQKSFR